MRVLVTGGAGYVGSVTTARLLADGHEVTVWDDLSHGHRDSVPDGAELLVGDVLDTPALERLCRARRFEGLVHFAGLIEVGESVREPARYWRVNVGGAASAFEAFLAGGG